MNVSVFGLGYVGCVTAGCLARAGHRVIGVDVNADKVAMIAAGTSPIVEPGLGDVLAEAVRNGTLSATTSAKEAVQASDVALICVGTPDQRNGQPNLDALARVAEDLAAALANRIGHFTVIVRSTVLPGTTERVIVKPLRDGLGAAFSRVSVAVNPEFMREGCSLEDFDHPPFILVGCDGPGPAGIVRGLYAKVDAPFVQTTVRTAEMVKYVCNAFHALKVCFSNEIGDLCEALGADAHDVMRVFRLDRKLNVSEAYLKPGFAFGGSCLPKDVRALVSTGRLNDIATPLLGAIAPSNDRQIRRGIDAVVATGRKRIGVVGLAFKTGTDDLRQSPVVTVVEALIGKGYYVRIYDPHVSMARLMGANRQYIETEIPHIASLLCERIDDLVSDVDALVFSAAGADAAAAFAAARPDQSLVDLTRGAVCQPGDSTWAMPLSKVS